VDVAVLRQMIDHHARSHGVPHALAHDAVEDAHTSRLRGCRADFEAIREGPSAEREKRGEQGRPAA